MFLPFVFDFEEAIDGWDDGLDLVTLADFAGLDKNKVGKLLGERSIILA